MTSEVRVRMAPSPTGFFHVGSARTALFNYLFAKQAGGKLILRIEDTDAERNKPEYEEAIYESMRWLGIEPDEGPEHGGDFGPYRQSERREIYAAAVQDMLSKGYAYEQDGCIRWKVKTGKVAWNDAVYGKMSVDCKQIEDFVIWKRYDGGVTYNFANAVDDAEMHITHIMRGEDGLSNTPKQILIREALGAGPVVYAHLPFILAPDRTKLSKRHGAVDLRDFREQGILPVAMMNHLALLGWNPGKGCQQETFTPEELIAKFSLSGVNKAGAVFDMAKLDSFNKYYLRQMTAEELAAVAGIQCETDYDRTTINMCKQRATGPASLVQAVMPFYHDDYPVDEDGIKKHINAASLSKLGMLEACLNERNVNWTPDGMERAVDLTTLYTGCHSRGEVIHPARLVLSGTLIGPSLFEMMAQMGKERVIRRLAAAQERYAYLRDA